MSLHHLIKSPKEIAAIRESGQMLGAVLTHLKKNIQPGIITKELDEIARAEIKRLGAKPAFYGYQGFPASICVSINDQVVHGIPGAYQLKLGDVASVDGGVSYKGMISDAAFTVTVGEPPTGAAKRLLEQTAQALNAGISVVKAGVTINDVSVAIEQVLKKAGLGIIRDLVGHGVGRLLHEEPEIPNYKTTKGGSVLLAGMTIAIEPMATLGGEAIKMGNDGWTISTRDGSLAAHFEHSLLITGQGAEILTLMSE